MAFTDEEVLLLHELDLELGDVRPPRRLVSLLWWVTMALGGVAMITTLVHAGAWLALPPIAY
jgi:hypothetical protein